MQLLLNVLLIVVMNCFFWVQDSVKCTAFHNMMYHLRLPLIFSLKHKSYMFLFPKFLAYLLVSRNTLEVLVRYAASGASLSSCVP